ncbi:baseplate J/gp47 family protein [Rosenbergiella epipactidis]|uniref:baseplate J/gp47 family protein n=1 Tax=Rosenbergiella epipactidis TaxID=1544694 RepID=UPI001F4E0DE1|nr:baseplate J/gp47 family protein [Rosenbergiella epipactidis]
MALDLDTLGLSATITAEGISAPDYQAILTTITGYFQQIYGTDAYLEPDSKDGQMVALVSLAIHDANNTAIACYNSFSPTTAQSDALSRNVKINGIARKAAVSSTVDVTLTGTPGTIITNGSVKDNNGVIWNLPATTTISSTGSVTVTATCNSSGAVSAQPGTVTSINTPTLGWVSVTNTSSAAVGRAIETDAELKQRQAISVSLASISPFDAVDGAVANISGVSRHKLYENDTDSVDSNGIPPHSIAAVVEGGDAEVIASTIRAIKGQGVTPYGTTVVIVSDRYGNPHSVGFSRPVDIPIYVSITIEALTGYTSQVGLEIKDAIASYINSLAIGSNVLLSRVYSPANIGVVSGGDSKYYDITELLIGISSGTVAAKNIAVPFNGAASCSVDNISITVAS